MKRSGAAPSVLVILALAIVSDAAIVPGYARVSGTYGYTAANDLVPPVDWGDISITCQTGKKQSPEIRESARHNFRVVTVVEALDQPWSMTWLPSGEMLVTERPGRLRIVRDGVLEPDPVAGLPQVYRQRGQGGFMDVAPHPDFTTNRLLYLSYGKPNADGSRGTTTVVRGRLEPGPVAGDLEGYRVVDVEEIFESSAWGDNNNHFAGRMVFDPDGYLFVAVGDRMVSPDFMAGHPAQDLTNHMGTIIRLHEDGSVPADNPFVGRADVLPEIWSYGHRNQQGLAVHPVTGEVWSNEHGPRGGDELNLIVGGENYGWPVVSHGIHYDGTVFTTETQRRGMESPRFAWIPSIGASGLMIYSGEQFPWWKGSVFVGGLLGQQLARISFDGHRAVSEETLLEGVLGRIRDVRQGPDGFIYLALEGPRRKADDEDREAGAGGGRRGDAEIGASGAGGSPKDSPWYHVLVDGADHTTYVAERNLEPDDGGQPISHPLVTTLCGEFQEGRYAMSTTLH